MGGPIVMERKGQESIGSPDVKHLGDESTGCYTDWGTFDIDLWLWIFKVKLYLGIVMEWKGQESIGCPDVKHHDYVTSRQRILLGTGVT